ncbi:MAG TPA: DUF4129 domain-containing protein [Caulobacterales bacterium]|nr:DUF4129 domain-containing protein [Caulobacterales bacterium]
MADTAAPSGQEQSFAEAHRAVLADHSLQFRFEDVARPDPPPPQNWAWLEAIAPYLQAIFWIGVAALTALGLYMIVREIIARLPARAKIKAAEQAAPVVEFRPTQARARALLEEADRLAREGRYAEAARVLLHRSIEDMQRNFPIRIAPSMTSREIAALDRLSATARAVFSKIALAVELSLFGGRDLDASQYQECRALYESFAFGSGR